MAAEAFAAQMLAERGYRVSERNVRNRGGEIDIVAWENETLCIVEVRYTETDAFGGPFATISEHKKSRLRRAAAAYLQTLPREPFVRFDVVGISGPLEAMRFDIVRDAFREES